jgi:tetratricopeptide (TPR) repeat protein
MRFALAVLLVSLPALADPKPPELAAAERAWAVAEPVKEPRAAATAWAAAGAAFDKAVAIGAADAYSAVLAWQNASSFEHQTTPARAHDPAHPTPLTPTEAHLVAALDVYLVKAGPTTRPDALFTRARLAYNHDRFGEAVPGFIELVTRHPDAAVAEYAAVMLLDALNLSGRHDELADWVDRMRANRPLLAQRETLAAQLDELHFEVQRKRAESLEALGTSDPSAYLRCANTYLDAVREHPKNSKRDEALYNAGVCFELGHAIDDAVKAYRRVIELRTPLADKARARMSALRP